MKKQYLLLTILGISLSIKSQEIFKKSDFNFHQKEVIVKQDKIAFKKEKNVGDTLFFDDFSTGISEWTSSGINASLWIYDLSGPGGEYTDATILPEDHSSNTKKSKDIIQSPSADNGFLDFIADEYGTNNNYPILNARIESPIIDLSNINAAELSFYHSFRVCCAPSGSIKVSVSTNNFITSKEIDASTEVSFGSRSGTRYRTINLTDFLDTANNTSNFKIRFNWSGYDSYFWQIDDVLIKEAPASDLELSKLYLEDIYSSVKFESTNIPKSLASTLNLSAIVSNRGGSKIPLTTKLKVNLINKVTSDIITTREGGYIFNHPTNDLWNKDTLVFSTGIDLSNLAIGSYIVEAILLSDNDLNTNNDTIIRTFNITDGFYGQTNFEANVTNGSDGYFGKDKIPFTVGNLFYVPGSTDVNLYGVAFSLYKNEYYSTTPFTDIEVKTYEVTVNNINNLTFLDLLESRSFVIAETSLPSENNTYKSVYFKFSEANDVAGPITLSPNKYYYVAISHQGETDSLTFAKSQGDDDFSSIIFVKENGTTGNFIWDHVGDQVLLDLDFANRNLSSIIEENVSINISNIFPNPTTGETSITYSLANASKVSVKVMDITGKVVYTEKESNKTEGKHTLNINAAAFNSGVYYVTIATDEAQVTKKLIRK